MEILHEIISGLRPAITNTTSSKRGSEINIYEYDGSLNLLKASFIHRRVNCTQPRTDTDYNTTLDTVTRRPIAKERVDITRFHAYRSLETSPSLCDIRFLEYGNERCFLSVRPEAI